MQGVPTIRSAVHQLPPNETGLQIGQVRIERSGDVAHVFTQYPNSLSEVVLPTHLVNAKLVADGRNSDPKYP